MKKIITGILYRLIRLLGRLSDKTVMRLLLFIRKLAAAFRNKPLIESLDEVISCWRMGPPYTDLIRAMARDSRPEELKDLLEGIFSEPGFRAG